MIDKKTAKKHGVMGERTLSAKAGDSVGRGGWYPTANGGKRFHPASGSTPGYVTGNGCWKRV